MNKIVVIGLGQFGQTVAQTLSQHNSEEILAIDKDRKIVDDFKNKVSSAVALDATDEEALRTQGIDKFDMAIVAIGERYFLSTVLTTALLKKIGLPRVISRGMRTASGIEEKILELVGADRVVLPSVETAERLAQELLETNILGCVPVSAGYTTIKLKTPPEFVSKTIKQLKLREKYKINLIGIKKADKETNYLPEADDKIDEEDILFLIGKEEDIVKLGKTTNHNVI